LAIFTAAWPVPPAAAWISTVCPAVTPPSGLSAASAVGQFVDRYIKITGRLLRVTVTALSVQDHDLGLPF
jgi:hypothetical protein